jgi:Spy/CpxP family protein refolding chaperone
MKSWKAWLLVTVIFVTGALAGAFAMRAYMAQNLPELLANTRQRFEVHFLEMLDRELDLTEEQKQRLLPILKEAAGKGDAIHASVRQQFDSLREETDGRIVEELDTQQRVKFAEFRARMEEMARRGPRPGDGRMPPPPPGFGPPPLPPRQ